MKGVLKGLEIHNRVRVNEILFSHRQNEAVPTTKEKQLQSNNLVNINRKTESILKLCKMKTFLLNRRILDV